MRQTLPKRRHAPVDRALLDPSKARVIMFPQAGIWLNIDQFCTETSRDRMMVNNRLRNSVVDMILDPARKGAKQAKLYRLRDLIEMVFLRDEEGNLNPEAMDPYRRKAYYAAELDRVTLLKNSGALVPALALEQRLAEIAKTVAQFFDTLPDILERDCGATPAFLAKLEERLDRVREDLYQSVLKGAEEPDKKVTTQQLIDSQPTESNERSSGRDKTRLKSAVR